MYDNNSRLHSVYVDLAFISSSFDDISHFCPLITFSCEKLKKKEVATTAGLEPARAKPKRFQVFLLNRSDKLPYSWFLRSLWCTVPVFSTQKIL